jgi:hypothetical protein
MDLTRLYNLTTPELRKEAERRGVTDTYAMSRGQLIQAIQNRAAPAPTEPPGLLGKVFGFAKWALQAAGESKTGSAPEAEPLEPAAAEPAPVPASAPESVPVPVLEPVPVAAEPEPASAEPEPASAPEVDSGPPSRPPAGVFSNHGGLFEEPIPTRTMARILAEQGHYKRSLAIYSILLEDGPGDGELLAEVEAVREEAKARRSQAPS